MKKKWIGLVLGLAVLIVLVAAYLCLKNYNKQQEQESETEEISVSVASIPEDSILGFSYRCEGETLEFEKDNGIWYYEADKDFPLDQEKVNTLAGNFAGVKAVRDLGEQDNLKDFGLEKPSNEISVKQTSGTEDIFYLGDKNRTTGYYYLYINNAANIYTVDSSLPDAFSGNLYSLAKMESLPSVTASNVTKAAVTKGSEKMSLVSSRDDSAVWNVSGSDGKSKTADSTKTTQLLSNLTSLYYKELIDYNCSDLSKYGLNEPAAKVRLEYTQTYEVAAEDESTQSSENVLESETQNVKTVTETKNLTILVGKQNQAGDYYVRVPNSNQVYTMAAESLEVWLNANAQDLAGSGQQTEK